MNAQNARGADVAPRATPAPVLPAAPPEPPALAEAPQVPYVPPPIPEGGGRMIVDKQGDRTVITTTELPPTIMSTIATVKDTAIGLGVILAIIVIIGPFARMIARRMERRPEMRAAENTERLQHQIKELQQSIDAMSVEVERISESQRFQSKLLHEASKGVAGGQ